MWMQRTGQAWAQNWRHLLWVGMVGFIMVPATATMLFLPTGNQADAVAPAPAPQPAAATAGGAIRGPPTWLGGVSAVSLYCLPSF